jgi:hypothetical protein
MRTSIRTVLVACSATATLFLAGPAFASCNGDGIDSGTQYTYAGDNPSAQSASWQLLNHRVRETTDTATSMNLDYCQDAFFDWSTSGGHYDARIVRNCAPGTHRETDSLYDGWWDEPANWAGRYVLGLQKGAGCGFRQTDWTYQSCEQFPARIPGCLVDNGSAMRYPNDAANFWVRTQSNQIHFYTGHDPSSAN